MYYYHLTFILSEVMSDLWLESVCVFVYFVCFCVFFVHCNLCNSAKFILTLVDNLHHSEEVEQTQI